MGGEALNNMKFALLWNSCYRYFERGEESGKIVVGTEAQFCGYMFWICDKKRCNSKRGEQGVRELNKRVSLQLHPFQWCSFPKPLSIVHHHLQAGRRKGRRRGWRRPSSRWPRLGRARLPPAPCSRRWARRPLLPRRMRPTSITGSSASNTRSGTSRKRR